VKLGGQPKRAAGFCVKRATDRNGSRAETRPVRKRLWQSAAFIAFNALADDPDRLLRLVNSYSVCGMVQMSR
jgi:hypothetical protein